MAFKRVEPWSIKTVERTWAISKKFYSCGPENKPNDSNTNEGDDDNDDDDGDDNDDNDANDNDDDDDSLSSVSRLTFEESEVI